MGNTSLTTKNTNVKFYKNELPAQPLGLTYGELCEFWTGDYDRLARDRYYIHWLFPTKDAGSNEYCQPIKDAEIQVFQEDEMITERFLRAFDMMLDFLGMRRKGSSFSLGNNADERLDFLQRNPHIYLKISRILTSLHLIGMTEIWENWLSFLSTLINNGRLANAKESYEKFWKHT